MSLFAVKKRFLTLDAMRGIAALVVLSVHLAGRLSQSLPGGYLAVDLFFVLSGFVLAQAYGDKSLTFVDFMRIRLVRLYPLYLVGLGLGVAAYLMSQAMTPSVASSIGLGLIFMPTFFDVPGVESGLGIYPFNAPSWSLFFELAVNALWFAVKPRLAASKFIFILAIGLVLLVGAGLFYGSLNVGTIKSTFSGGVCRVIYSFFAGAAVFRFWRSTSFRVRLPSWIIVGLLLAVFAMPFWRAQFDIIAALVIFPALVFLGACAEPPKWAEGISAELGTVSYAIYVLHSPVVVFVSVLVLAQPAIKALAHPGFISTPITWVALGLLVWGADRYYDVPVRRWLSR